MTAFAHFFRKEKIMCDLVQLNDANKLGGVLKVDHSGEKKIKLIKVTNTKSFLKD